MKRSMITVLALLMIAAQFIIPVCADGETVIYDIYNGEYNYTWMSEENEIAYFGMIIEATKPELDYEDKKEGEASLKLQCDLPQGGAMALWITGNHGAFKNRPADVTKAARPALSMWVYFSDTGVDGKTGEIITIFVGEDPKRGIPGSRCDLYYLRTENLQNGWNKIVIPLFLTVPANNDEGQRMYTNAEGLKYTFRPSPEPLDYSKLNIFNFQTESTGLLTMRIDAVKYVDLGKSVPLPKGEKGGPNNNTTQWIIVFILSAVIVLLLAGGTTFYVLKIKKAKA